MIQEIIILVILLFFSFLFSICETSLISLDIIKIKRIQKNKKDTIHLQSLLSSPSRFIATILIGDTFVNIILSSMLTSILIGILGGKGVAISIVISTLLLLIFGEVTPKALAIKRAEDFAYNIARPLDIFAKLITPFRLVFDRFAHRIIGLLGVKLEKQGALTSDELKAIINLSHRHGIVKENEKEMIRSVLELTQTQAKEIMTPRPDIKALSVDASQKQALDFLKEAQYSKIPVYKSTVDNITGVLYAKDALFSPEIDFKNFIKPAIFIPESKKIDDLLKSFESKNSKVAVVVDEYGSTYGLVTFEDILEEIVGEIYDEFETKESFIEKIDEKTFRVNGKTQTYLVEEGLKIEIPKGNYDTIAGYMLYIFKKIPQEGESMKVGKLSFLIEKLAARRIRSIIIRKT